jgi:hypothetical protein
MQSGKHGWKCPEWGPRGRTGKKNICRKEPVRSIERKGPEKGTNRKNAKEKEYRKKENKEGGIEGNREAVAKKGEERMWISGPGKHQSSLVPREGLSVIFQGLNEWLPRLALHIDLHCNPPSPTPSHTLPILVSTFCSLHTLTLKLEAAQLSEMLISNHHTT